MCTSESLKVNSSMVKVHKVIFVVSKKTNGAISLKIWTWAVDVGAQCKVENNIKKLLSMYLNFSTELYLEKDNLGLCELIR